VNLINRFATIVAVVGSEYEINVPAFDDYCRLTFDLYVKLYPWYFMSPTVHKVNI